MVARELDVDPEAALRTTNAKFVRRFKYIETKLETNGSSPEESTLAEMDALWDEAKAAERQFPPEPTHPDESRDPADQQSSK